MKRRQAGMTLIELVIAIVVVAICAATAMELIASLSMRSASSMVRTQAAAIATSYLDEITSKNYAADGREASRQLYDDVLDYDGLDEMGPRDATGVAIAGLARYRVQVRVVDDLLPNNVAARRISVTVTDPTDVSILLIGYRTDYASQVYY